MEIKDMTKSELIAEIEKRGLTDKLAELGADPKKVVNDKLIELLETNPAVNTVATEAPVKKSLGKKMDLNDTIEYLNTALPCIIVDHDNSYTIKDDDDNRVIEISWGNKLVGRTREKIGLHGRRQYITRGAIQKMKTMNIPRVRINQDTGALSQAIPKTRFTVTPVEGFTEDEINALIEKNKLKLPTE